MAFNFNKLRGRIVEKFGSCAKFAAAMGHSKVWLSSRLNNVVPWKADEMREAADLLGIAPEEIPRYFLTPKF